ncbi:Zinc finger CCCH domain-containing protein 34 [Sesamum angolense]|uniref:Zinc finger CCCH domain-containing protein 34 n=1 Tax=Sesamum angolense TaxID=2727404 RepID=A0AAE1X5C0_9LAMI|nr:Zinc finger CCCH domain-containing protein 34 [Sesamum angolense]
MTNTKLQGQKSIFKSNRPYVDHTGVGLLLEPMWQLGLGGGPESYPERPDEPDCIYYLRTGFCGYGNRCRFNHPRDRSMAMGALRAGAGEYPERVGQPLCQYYMRTGMCKFGASCKYHHPKHGVGSSAPVTLNVYGYPLRPGEKECSYFVKTGQCKFGVTCKFHHPQPAGIQVPAPPGPGAGPLAAPAGYPSMQSPSGQSSQQYGVIQGNWPVARPAMLPGSYVPGSYGPMLFPPGVVPVPGWTPYPAPVSPVASSSAQPTVGPGPIYGLTQLSPSATAYTGIPSVTSAGPSSSSQKEHPFPERPGQPECQVLHFVLTMLKMEYASCSLPVGSTNATLAPSTSSSDLRPELLSGYNKDAFSWQMSSMNSSSAAGGSLFSTSGAVPQSSAQQSGQGSISSSGGSTISRGGEVHASS